MFNLHQFFAQVKWTTWSVHSLVLLAHSLVTDKDQMFRLLLLTEMYLRTYGMPYTMKHFLWNNQEKRANPKNTQKDVVVFFSNPNLLRDRRKIQNMHNVAWLLAWNSSCEQKGTLPQRVENKEKHLMIVFLTANTCKDVCGLIWAHIIPHRQNMDNFYT